MTKAILIGGINKKNKPRGGQEAKNQKLLQYLKKVNRLQAEIDTHNWKIRFPFIFLQLLQKVFFKKNQKIIISAADESAYRLIVLLKAFGTLKNNQVHYFVIGGNFAAQLQQKPTRVKQYNTLTGIYPESKKMVEQAQELGLHNLQHIPNFREVPKPITKTTLAKEGMVHFIYLARITPDKGSEIVLDACQILNKKGLESKYKVHFFGFFHPDTDQYEERFMTKINPIPNAEYKGFLDVNSKEGFQTLYNYDVLLFPTYWATEGYSGTLIDALSAGLPAIASDWNYNAEIVEHDYNGKLIHPKSADSLSIEMKNMIAQPKQIITMSTNACTSANNFDISYLLSKTVFLDAQ